MPHEGNMLQAAVVFLLAAVITVPLAKRLQLGAVLGYLLAGVIIGPAVLGLAGNPQSVGQISELGVVLLLFIIGLELSPRRLWVMRKSVFGVGLAQVLLTGVVIGTVALLGFDQPLNAAVVLGLGLALSSTAFGLQSLAERKELNSPHGRLAFSILLFQDIAAIPLIAMVPLLAGVEHNAENDLAHGLQILGSIAIVVIGGRYLLRPVFRIVAKTGLQEVSTATALLVVIGTAWLMELAGVSMALGAFLAGLLLADSEYRHELEAQIEPFKGLLLGLFFISVGMGTNIGLLFSAPVTVLELTLLLILLKLPLLYFVGRMAGGLGRESALRLGLVLAAGGEFAFVVFKIGRDQGLFEAGLYDLLVLTITLSMAVTPLLLLLGARAEPGTACDEQVVMAAVERLLDEDVSLDVRDPRGFGPLHLAALHGLPLLVQRLLRAGADPEVRDSLNRSPREIAVMRGFIDVAGEFEPRVPGVSSMARFLRDNG